MKKNTLSVLDSEDMTIETISVDENGNIDPISFEYNEYRSELNGIYRMTNEINSIVSTFNIEDNKCHHILTVKYNNGMISKEKDFVFDYTEGFKSDFFVPMIEDFCKHNTIRTEGITTQDNNLVLNVVTTDNDMLVIKNLDSVFASQIENIIYDNNRDNINFISNKRLMNESGKGNIAIIILAIVLVGLIVIGCIYFITQTGKID